MDKRKIGSLEVTVVGLGTNNFGMAMEADEVERVVDAALAIGINFFDTADAYGASEERLGRAIGSRRDQVVIATKFGWPLGKDHPGGARPEYVRSAIERSLRNLGTEWIDLYQLHRPDPETPIGDTLAVLNQLVDEGKVGEIGCSNFSAEQLREADAVVEPNEIKFVSVQNAYNLLDRSDEDEAVGECARLNLSYIPWSPLANGMLTGKYRRGQKPGEGTRFARFGDQLADTLSDRNFDIVDSLSEWAHARGHTLLELAIAWLLGKSVVASVIAGARTETQVQQNAGAAGWQLTAEEMAEVDRLCQ